MKYTGKICMHYEQSCGYWPQFHDDRGCHGDKLQFWNWNYTINFNHKTKLDKLFIYDNDGVVLYDGSFKSSHDTETTLINKLLRTHTELNCEIETDEILKALEKEYN